MWGASLDREVFGSPQSSWKTWNLLLLSQPLILAYIMEILSLKQIQMWRFRKLLILLSHLSTNNTTIILLTEENIIIRTLVPYVSPFPKNYVKRDFEEDLDESFKPPRKCRPYCRCYACRMAFRKAMEDLEELDEINERTSTEDQSYWSNQSIWHSSWVFLTSQHWDSHRWVCESVHCISKLLFPSMTSSPRWDIYPVTKNKQNRSAEIGNRVVRSLERTCMMYL